VLVIGGPDDQVYHRFCRFLVDLKLQPVDMLECMKATGSMAPRNMDVVRAGLRLVQAAVVLLTPALDGNPWEGGSGSGLLPDPDVLVQAGLALNEHPTRTMLVTAGPVQLPTSLRDHAHIPLDDTAATMQVIAQRLEHAGCPVDRSDTDHLRPGAFHGLSAYHSTVNQREQLMPNPRDVFVIHGRDEQARAALWGFLRAIDLHPLDWEEVVGRTSSSMPSLIQALHRAFEDIQAAVILLTPDDGALLHPGLRGPDEPGYETELTGQGRPNVLFEAGMALALYPNRSLIVEVGRLRPFSDIGGLNVIKFDGTAPALQKIAKRLQIAGCAVNTSGTDFLDTSRFVGLDAYTRRF
jgi:predicted nucleotide-binding protein